MTQNCCGRVENLVRDHLFSSLHHLLLHSHMKILPPCSEESCRMVIHFQRFTVTRHVRDSVLIQIQLLPKLSHTILESLSLCCSWDTNFCMHFLAFNFHGNHWDWKTGGIWLSYKFHMLPRSCQLHIAMGTVWNSTASLSGWHQEVLRYV